MQTYGLKTAGRTTKNATQPLRLWFHSRRLTPNPVRSSSPPRSCYRPPRRTSWRGPPGPDGHAAGRAACRSAPRAGSSRGPSPPPAAFQRPAPAPAPRPAQPQSRRGSGSEPRAAPALPAGCLPGPPGQLSSNQRCSATPSAQGHSSTSQFRIGRRRSRPLPLRAGTTGPLGGARLLLLAPPLGRAGPSFAAPRPPGAAVPPQPRRAAAARAAAAAAYSPQNAAGRRGPERLGPAGRGRGGRAGSSPSGRCRGSGASPRLVRELGGTRPAAAAHLAAPGLLPPPGASCASDGAWGPGSAGIPREPLSSRQLLFTHGTKTSAVTRDPYITVPREGCLPAHRSPGTARSAFHISAVWKNPRATIRRGAAQG